MESLLSGSLLFDFTRHLSVSWGIVIELALLAVLSLLSGAEAAILAVNRLRARHDAETGSRAAKAVVYLHANKENFLPSLLALETLLTVTISALGTALATSIRAGAAGLLVSTLVITVCVLVVGEIVPKTIATHRPNHYSYLAAPAIVVITRFLSVVLRPLTWTLRSVLGIFEHNPAHGHAIPTEKELKYLITVSREHGIINQDEEELLQNIFDFTDSKVGEVMIPRTKIECVEESATVKEVLDKFAETRYSRYPVYSKDLDNIVGFLDVRDLFAVMAEGKQPADLKKFIRPANFVPESKRVGNLLQEMRTGRFQVAIVVDEYGGTAGFVTVTDLIEEIVGKLEAPGPAQEIYPLDPKTLILPASTKLEELEERLDVKFDVKDVQTVGGLVFGLFGRVPEEGDQVRYDNLKFTVTEKDGYKISKVMVTQEVKDAGTASDKA